MLVSRAVYSEFQHFFPLTTSISYTHTAFLKYSANEAHLQLEDLPLWPPHRWICPLKVCQSLGHVHTLSPCGLQPSKLLCPWNSTGKNTGDYFTLQISAELLSLQSYLFIFAFWHQIYKSPVKITTKELTAYVFF